VRVLRTLARPPAVRAARIPYNVSSDRSVPLMAILSGERSTHVDTSQLHHSTPPLDLWQQNAGARSLATRRARHALAPPVGRCTGWVPQLSPSPSSSPPPPHSSRTLTLILTLTSLTSTVKVNLILRGHYYMYCYYYYAPPLTCIYPWYPQGQRPVSSPGGCRIPLPHSQGLGSHTARTRR
jgi:hypothetical protein